MQSYFTNICMYLYILYYFWFLSSFPYVFFYYFVNKFHCHIITVIIYCCFHVRAFILNMMITIVAFILKSWSFVSGLVLLTWHVVESLLVQCRRCDVIQSRSAGSTIWTAAGRASPIGRHSTITTTRVWTAAARWKGWTKTWRKRHYSSGFGLIDYLFPLFIINLFISLCQQQWPRSMAAAAEREAGAISSTKEGMDSTRADPQAGHCAQDQTLSAGGEW